MFTDCCYHMVCLAHCTARSTCTPAHLTNLIFPILVLDSCGSLDPPLGACHNFAPFLLPLDVEVRVPPLQNVAVEPGLLEVAALQVEDLLLRLDQAFVHVGQGLVEPPHPFLEVLGRFCRSGRVGIHRRRHRSLDIWHDRFVSVQNRDVSGATWCWERRCLERRQAESRKQGRTSEHQNIGSGVSTVFLWRYNITGKGDVRFLICGPMLCSILVERGKGFIGDLFSRCSFSCSRNIKQPLDDRWESLYKCPPPLLPPPVARA